MLERVRLGRAAVGERDPIQVARDWLDEYGQVALATVVSTWGSSPVPKGGHLTISPEGAFQGSVSGGCVEVDVICEADDVLTQREPRLLEFGVGSETALRAGLPCGGTIQILVEPLEGEDDLAFLDAVLEARRDRHKLLIVTDVASGERQIFRDGHNVPEDVECDGAHESRLLERDEGQAFLNVVVPPVRLLLVGATHISQVLADMAKAVGWDVIIVDPRSSFASPERLSGIPCLTDWPQDAFAAVGLDERTAVVALTHAASIDDEALETALLSDCLYVGALGSKRTHQKRLERLKDSGFDEDKLAEIHGPVGLSIGARGPAEIAVSILAEIIRVARKPS